MSGIKAFIIQPGDTTAEVGEIPAQYELAVLQDIVGGYIEGVYSADGQVTFFCNEEGKIHDLPVNGFATALWWIVNPDMANVDTLNGPVVIMGGADGEGDTLPVPDEMIKLVNDLYMEEER